MTKSEDWTPRLGEWVRAEHRLKRFTHWRNYGSITPKEWVPIPEPIEGMFIGWRTYANGEREWFDDMIVFTPHTRLKVALIVKNARSNPVPVLFSDMRPMEDSE